MLPSRLLTLTRQLLAAPPISTSDPTSSLPDVELDDLSPASATSEYSNFDDDFSFSPSYASSEASEPETPSRRSSISSFASSFFFSNTNSSAPSTPPPAAEPETPSRQIFSSGMSNTRYRQAHQQVCRKYW